jgi:Flp pilus assembly protein TadG
MMTILRRTIKFLLRPFFQCEQGGMAIGVAVALPVLAFIAVGAFDFCGATVDRSRMQGVVDAAALAGAQQLAIDTSTATADRAQSYATAQLKGLLNDWTTNITSQVVNNGTGVQVTVTASRPALLLNMLPAGGWHVSVNATAQTETKVPLCALGTSTGALLGSVVNLTQSSQVTAPNCLVQSDQDIAAQNSAQVSAGAVQVVGNATGSISPTPLTGAPPLPDPFRSVNVNVPTLCTDLSLTFTSGTQYLAPGVHCGVIVVSNNATLILQPGEHYFFAATLTLDNHAVLQGTDVALVFDATSVFSFKQSSDIELEGRQSGPLAGFVIATTRDNILTFNISTTSAHKLLGVVYMPSGLLNISGTGKVAEASSWTVIVAHALNISGSANLTLNANYFGASVPVPAGVGTNGASHVYLSQ